MLDRTNRSNLDEQLRAILAALARIESQLSGRPAARGVRLIPLSTTSISDRPTVDIEPEPEPEPDSGGFQPWEGPVLSMLDQLIEDLRTINEVPKTTDEALGSARALAETVESRVETARDAVDAVRKTKEVLPCVRLLCKICKLVPKLNVPVTALDLVLGKLQTLLDEIDPTMKQVGEACDEIIDALDSLESDMDAARYELAPTKIFFQEQVDEFVELARTQGGNLSSSLQSCVTHLHEVVDPVAGVVSDFEVSQRLAKLNSALETIDSTIKSFNLAFEPFIQLRVELDLLHGWLAPIAGWLKVADELLDAVAGFIFDIIDGLVGQIPAPFFDDLERLINDILAEVNAWLDAIPSFDVELSLPTLIPQELRETIAAAKAEIERLRATAECYLP